MTGERRSMAPPLTPEKFREECDRRLIDAFDVMQMAGLRSREGINARVHSGALPQPVYRTSKTTLWDRDEVDSFLTHRGH
jgi:predicted DNA-binding transcriptional regulator AlpA